MSDAPRAEDRYMPRGIWHYFVMWAVSPASPCAFFSRCEYVTCEEHFDYKIAQNKHSANQYIISRERNILLLNFFKFNFRTFTYTIKILIQFVILHNFIFCKNSVPFSYSLEWKWDCHILMFTHEQSDWIDS